MSFGQAVKTSGHGAAIPGVTASRVKIAVLPLLFVALVCSGGCRSGGGSADADSGLFSEDAGGGIPTSHWDTINTTSGAFLSLVFFEDETGQVLFGNDSFARGTGDGVTTRTVYSMTWEATDDDAISVSLDDNDFEFDLDRIEVGSEDQTFEARYSDDEGSMDFDFTRQVGLVNF